MKKLLLIIHFTFSIIHFSFTQDSLRYSQEQGTLEKQRFIDQYDYIARESTKWMPKVFIDRSGNSLALRLGVERKLSSSFSLGVNISTPVGSNSNQKSLIYSETNTELRYYFNIKKRIESGASNDNFSGNYAGLRYGLPLVFKNQLDQPLVILNKPFAISNTLSNRSVGLTIGMQRRYLKKIFFDFSLLLSQTSYQKFILEPNLERRLEKYSVWGFSTELRYGLVFGNWKRGKRTPFKNVMRFYEEERSMLKVDWPLLRIGQNGQNATVRIGYERKIRKSSFSIHVGATQIYNRSYSSGSPFSALNDSIRIPSSARYNSLLSTQSETIITLQGRYNLLQRKNKLANNLSGIYIGANMNYERLSITQRFDNTNLDNDNEQQRLRAGLLLGFQVRLFKNGFIDCYFPLNVDVWRKEPNKRLSISSIPFVTSLGFAF